MYQNTTFKLIPLIPNTKLPLDKGYNESTYNPAITTNQVAIAHLPSGTCSLDIDDYKASSLFFKEQFNVDLKALIESNPFIYNGNPNKYKILYKISTPLRTKQIIRDKKVLFELRCIGKDGRTSIDTIPPSMHPDTKLLYVWVGDVDKIQEVPSWLITYWQSLLVIKKPTKEHDFDITYNEIEEALVAIGTDSPYDDWLNVGMAIHHADSVLGENRGFDIFNKWSQASTQKYNRYNTKTTYNSFSVDPNGIKIGTLLGLAAENGWYKKTDVSGMFSAVVMNQTGTTTMKNPHDIVEGLRPIPPNLNLTVLPPIVQSMANQLSVDIGADPITTVFACLAAASGAVDSRITLEITNGFKVKPILRFMTVGDPASKKTPASEPLFEVLDKLEIEDIKRYSAEKVIWDIKDARYNKQKSDHVKYESNPMNNINPINPVAVNPMSPMAVNDNSSPMPDDIPPPPNRLTIIVQDITSQKLVPLCGQNPRGLLCYLDEMTGWVEKMVLRSNEDRSTWTQSYEGKRYKYDRVGTGHTPVKNMAVSMYGNIQPDILKKYIHDLSKDGLLQRFVPGVLRNAYDKVGRRGGTPESLSAKPFWEATIERMFKLTETNYTLSPEAYDEFRRFEYWVEKEKIKARKGQGGGRNAFMGALGKATGLSGRIALVFHLIETQFTPVISLNTIQRAIFFVKGYIIPSYKFTYSEIGGEKEYEFITWITNYVIGKSNTINLLTLSEIKRSGIRQWEQMQIKDNYKKDGLVRDEMVIMESYGWVVPIGNKDNKWQITQELTSQFHTYRAKIIKDRESLYQDESTQSQKI